MDGAHDPPRGGPAPFPWRAGAWLLALSLGVRLLAWWAVTAADTPLRYDEITYQSRALAAERMLAALAELRAPGDEDWTALYGRGTWPPLQPILLGAARWLLGEGLGALRLVGVVVSALTTLLVLDVGRRLVSPRAAGWGAAIHAIHPAFVFFSHTLWSETTFVALLLLGVRGSLSLLAAGDERLHAGRALGTGAALGAAALTRTAALPYLAIVPAWLLLVGPRTRRVVLRVALLVATIVVLLLPWQLALSSNTGRLTPLTSASGYYLWLGNNPWVVAGTGSAWGHTEAKQRLADAGMQHARERGISFDEACRELALAEIREDLPTFLGRSLDRFRMTWAADVFIVRHLLSLTYPPVPAAVVLALWLLVLVVHLAVGAAVVWGWVAPGDAPRHAWLLALLVVASLVPPSLTQGMSRLSLPALALLLPVAGRGLASLRRRPTLPRAAAGLVGLAAVLWCSLGALPITTALHLRPSTHYAGLLADVDALLGTSTSMADRVVVRVEPTDGLTRLDLDAGDSGHRFVFNEQTRMGWNFDARSPTARIDIFAHEVRGPLELTLTWRGQTTTIRPLDESAWFRWQPAGMEGVSYRWEGCLAQPPER